MDLEHKRERKLGFERWMSPLAEEIDACYCADMDCDEGIDIKMGDVDSADQFIRLITELQILRRFCQKAALKHKQEVPMHLLVTVTSKALDFDRRCGYVLEPAGSVGP